jgi:hypothetical protein
MTTFSRHNNVALPKNREHDSSYAIWSGAVRRGHIFVLVAMLAVATARAADDSGVELVKSTPLSVAKGQRAAVSLTLLPRAGNRLLDDGPLLVHTSGDGLAVERTLYRREDAVDPRAEAPRFELAFRALRPGPAELRARCTFYVCHGARCRPVESEAVFTVEIAP